ncbi:MAG: hypothetical protein QXP74_03695 [Nitrososphaerota archaeon]
MTLPLSMLSPLEKGRAEGKLSLECFEKIDLNTLLQMHPEYMEKLEVLREEARVRGWSMEYVDHLARVLGEINLEGVEYQLMPWSPLKARYSIMIDVGTTLPTIKDVKLHKLVYSISTENMREDSIEIDVVKNRITHIDEVFWEWEEGWEKDRMKLLEALDTYKILKWLIEEKKYSLREDYDERKYRKICEYLERIAGKIEETIQYPQQDRVG